MGIGRMMSHSHALEHLKRGHLFASHSDAENITGAKPVAFLPEQTFEFEPVIEGAVVIHDFIIQNKGTVLLVIHRVSSG